MIIKPLVLILLPFVLLVLFTYKSYKKFPLDFDLKLTRRIYYLLAVLYIVGLVFFFNDTIKSIDLFKLGNTTLNYIINIAFIFIGFVIWEYIFISCRSFKTIKLKDTELTFDDLTSTKYVDSLQEKEKENLYAVLNAKIKMVKYIDDYISNRKFNRRESYKEILKEYGKNRKNVKIDVYFDNKEEIMRLQKENNITDKELSSVFYSINLTEFCIPKDFRKENYIFARLKTKYTEDDIIVVMYGELLIDKENLILAEILNYFETKIELELQKIYAKTA